MAACPIESRGSCPVCHQEVTTAHLRVNRDGNYFHADCAQPLARRSCSPPGHAGRGGDAHAGARAVPKGAGASGTGSPVCNVDDEGAAWVTVATVPVHSKSSGTECCAGRGRDEEGETDDAQLARETQWSENGETLNGERRDTGGERLGRNAVGRAGGHRGNAFVTSGRTGRRQETRGGKERGGSSWRGALAHNLQQRCDDVYDRAVASAVMSAPRVAKSPSRAEASGRDRGGGKGEREGQLGRGRERGEGGREEGREEGGRSGAEGSGGRRPESLTSCGEDEYGENEYTLPAEYSDRCDSHHVCLPCWPILCRMCSL